MHTTKNRRKQGRGQRTQAGRQKLFEHLESRVMLSAGEWLVKFNNVPGDTRDTQLTYIQGLFHDAGLDSHGVEADEHVGVDGVVIVHTDPAANLYDVMNELQPLPGFASIEPWDDSASPGARSIYVPESPLGDGDATQNDGDPDHAPSGWNDTSTLSGGSGGSAAPSLVQSGTGFNGINDSQTAQLSPPDSDGAVGPNAFLEAVNTALALYNKSTGATIGGGITQFSTFFSPLGGVLSFSDPIVAYNDITQQFFVGVLDLDFSSQFRLDVAISKTSNPQTLTASDWNFYRFNANDGVGGTDWPDYPKVGYNADGYVVSFNMFPGGGSFDHVSVLGISNNGTGTGMRVMPGGFSNFTLAPASMHGAAPGAPMWFVGDGNSGNGGSSINVLRLDNPFSSAAVVATSTPISVPSFGNAPNPRQPGGTLGGLDSGYTDRTSLGTRFYFSGLRTVGGVTYLVSADTVGNGTGTSVRWYEFNVSSGTPTLLQQGSVNPNPATTDTYFPEMDIGPDGSLGLNYSESGPSEYMSMYVTGRKPNDAAGTMETPVLAKTNASGLHALGRAGDYSFTSVDPVDGTYWAVNEYASSLSSPNWATWIQHWSMGGLAVIGSTPAAGGVVGAPPTQFTMNFSDAIDPITLQAGDLTVNAIPADSVSLGADGLTATFTYNTSPVSVQGQQTMAMAAGAVAKLGDPSTTLTAFNANFHYDAVLLQVVSTTPAVNGVFVLPGPFTYDVTFNEPVDPASVQTNDLTLSGIAGASISNVAVLPGNMTARFTITGMTSEGFLVVSLAAGAINDAFGNPGASFSASYSTDVSVIAYPTPLTPKNPPGSLIYDPTVSGVIGVSGDTDGYTITVDPGQTITVLVTASNSLQPAVTLLDPSSAIAGSATAAGSGQAALLQTIQSTGGTYTILVSGAGGSVGSYQVQVTLNSALESENVLPGVDDDSIATAQDLSGAFIALSPNSPGMQRAAVLGSTIGGTGNLVTNGGFENGNFSGWSTTTTGTPYAPWAVAPAGQGGGYNMLTTSPQEGTYDAWNGFDGAGPMEYTMTQDIFLPGGLPLTLTWKDRLQWNFTVASGLAQARTYFVELVNPNTSAVLATLYSFSTGPESTNPTGNTGWVTHSADLSAYAGSTVRLRFREEIPESYTGPAQAEFDAVAINLTPAADYYKFTLNAGETATVAATALGSSNLTLELRDASNNLLATGTGGATNLSKIVSNFKSVSGGTYYIRLIGDQATPYSIVVTKNTAFDIEGNDSYGAAQPIDGTQGALGYVTGGAQNGAVLESFDQGPADLSNYTFISTNNASITPDAAHDGTYGLQIGDQTEWFYRNDATVHVQQGNVISEWVRSSAVGGGRTYLGFGASATGTLSMVMADNTSSLVLQDDAGYSFNQLASVPQTWLANHWYRFEITWGVGGAITGRLYDSDGTTLLNTVSATDNSITGGGIAFRGFGGVKSVDTVSTNGSLAGNDDWYSLNANAGAALTFQTSTPGDGPGEFANALNPHIELYDPSNVLVASGALLADGRNEVIHYTALVDGTYRVRVSAEGGTAGAYVLSENAGLSVVSTVPNGGSVVSAPPTVFTVNFSDPIDPASLDAGDLTVNGILANGVSLSADGKSATFIFPSSPVTAQGVQTIAMAGGAVWELADPTKTLNPFSTTFRYDALLLQVVTTSPAVGGQFALQGPNTFDVNFNEPVDPSSVQASDLAVSGVPGASVSNVQILAGNTTVRFTITGMTGEGFLTASIAAGAINDQFGNPGAAFSGNYATDLDPVAFPTPLIALNPLGSMIYDPTASGLIGTAGDTDTFTLSVDPSQTITVLVTPTSGNLQPTVQLINPANAVIGSANAAGGNQNALLQTVPTTGPSTDTYKIVVGGVGASIGAYKVQVVLNAALENEGNLTGAADNARATAQDISASSIRLGTTTAKRLAVTGTMASATDADYYSMVLAAGDVVSFGVTGQSAGNIAIELRNSSDVVLATGVSGATNFSRTISNFTIATAGTYYLKVTGDANLAYTLLGLQNAGLDAEPNDTIVAAQNISGLQGVAGGIAGGGSATLTLTAADSGWYDSTGLHGSSNKNYIAGLGSTGDHHDYFVFNLAGITQNITGAQLSALNPSNGYSSPDPSETLAFFDVSTPVATLEASNSGQTGIFNDLGSGIAFGSRSVSAADDGQQVVTTLNSDAIAALNAARGSQFAIGGAVTTIVGTSQQFIFGFTTGSETKQLQLTFGGAEDWYSVNVASIGNVLKFSTMTPGDGPGEFNNVLNPHIELYNPNGALVASGTVLPDGRNESIQYAATMSGVYRVRVTGENSSLGEYFLSSQVVPTPALVGATIDDGTAQRSRVRSVTLTVNGTITSAPVSAFTLTRTEDSLNVPVVVQSITQMGSQTQIVLTFSGPSLQAGSLADGRYTLSINGSLITDVYGQKLDAAGTGVPGSSRTLNFFRFFGDANGDGIVDATDYLIFRTAYLSGNATGLNSAYDFNGDGLFTAADLQAFTNNMRIRTLV